MWMRKRRIWAAFTLGYCYTARQHCKNFPSWQMRWPTEPMSTGSMWQTRPRRHCYRQSLRWGKLVVRPQIHSWVSSSDTIRSKNPTWVIVLSLKQKDGWKMHHKGFIDYLAWYQVKISTSQQRKISWAICHKTYWTQSRSSEDKLFPF